MGRKKKYYTEDEKKMPNDNGKWTIMSVIRPRFSRKPKNDID